MVALAAVLFTALSFAGSNGMARAALLEDSGMDLAAPETVGVLTSAPIHWRRSALAPVTCTAASGSSGGCLTSGTQTIAGAKTFSSTVTSSALPDSFGAGGAFALLWNHKHLPNRQLHHRRHHLFDGRRVTFNSVQTSPPRTSDGIFRTAVGTTRSA